MKVEQHHQRVVSLMTAVDGLSSVDAEIHFDAALELSVHAMTHCFNILLHNSGIRGIDADQIHSDMPSDLRSELSADQTKYLNALTQIETLRMLYVRGNCIWSPERFIELENIHQLFFSALNIILPNGALNEN